MTFKIGFVGAGKMATAIIEGILAKGLYKKDEILASCRSGETKKRIEEQIGIACVLDTKQVFEKCDFIILAVKPDQIEEILSTNIVANSSNKLIASVAAGVKIKTLESYVPDAKIVRIMPNVCSTVLESASSYTLGSNATPEDGKKIEDILNAIGYAFEIPENKIDAVTGLSGSSPAFMFMILDALCDAGIQLGLPRELAMRLASQTMLGSAKTLMKTGKTPEELKQSVCSPGGTTIEGVKVLDDDKVKESMIKAVKASAEKSKKMGKK